MVIIACLGYRLNPDGSMTELLINRLQDSARLCQEHPEAVLLLMGSHSYRDEGKSMPTEASVMKQYLEQNYPSIFQTSRVVTEENTTTSVEQICFLKSYVQDNNLNLSGSDRLFIVSSKFIGHRIRLYVDHIFGQMDSVEFVDSELPYEITAVLEEAEVEKLAFAHKWLDGRPKDDDKEILREMHEFQQKILNGSILYPNI